MYRVPSSAYHREKQQIETQKNQRAGGQNCCQSLQLQSRNGVQIRWSAELVSRTEVKSCQCAELVCRTRLKNWSLNLESRTAGIQSQNPELKSSHYCWIAELLKSRTRFKNWSPELESRTRVQNWSLEVQSRTGFWNQSPEFKTVVQAA